MSSLILVPIKTVSDPLMYSCQHQRVLERERERERGEKGERKRERERERGERGQREREGER